MSFEDDAELINSYNDWVLERKRMATDLTPETFLADRMKQDAADRVFKAIEHIETYGEWNPKTKQYKNLIGDPTQLIVRVIEEILRGDL